MRKIKIAAMFLAILMAAAVFVSCGKSDNTIVVGSKQFTENYLLGEIYAQLLEGNTDLTVERSLFMASTTVCMPALENGDLDMYVEYSGTMFGEVLKYGPVAGIPSDEIYSRVKDGMAEKNIKFFDHIGVNSAYAVAMRREQAEELGVKTMSDLIPLSPELRFGSAHVFAERESDGRKAMLDIYGFNFADMQIMDSSLLYQAISQNQLDVIIVFETDALLIEYDLALLEDDKDMFPPYHGAPIVRYDALEKHAELNEVFNMLAGKLDNEVMRPLCYQVDVVGRPLEEVAKEFLTDNGFI